MSDPTKYYEAQSSGLGTMTEKRFPEPSLPVIIEFPKNWNVERRLQWYNKNDFYSTLPISDGDAHDKTVNWQTQIDTAYAGSGKWRRGALMGPWRPEEGVSIEEATRSAPIIDAESLAIRFELIPENTVLGLDLGKTVGEYGGELGVVNYLKDPSRAKRADVITNYIASDGKTITRNLYPNISHTALPAKGIDFAVTSGVPSASEQRPAGTDRDRQLIEAQIQQAYEQDINLEQRKSRMLDWFLTDQLGLNQAQIDSQKANWEIDMTYKKEDDRNVLSKMVIRNKQTNEDWEFSDPAQLADLEVKSINYSMEKYKGLADPSLGEGTVTWKDPNIPRYAPTGTSSFTQGVGTTTGMADTPLGANLAAPGIPMPGSLQQQALSRVPLSEYRQALPAAMPGGDIPLMRGLYRTPLSLAQNAYSLATQMGAFSPANIPGGTGAHEFQQYLGGQPDWRGDLQRGLAAIETVKQKIISGVSPNQLSDPEKAIYTSYIGGTEDDPYAGSKRELALRQQLTSMLPMPLRQSASQNLQNIYNQALATRPTTVGGMPQAFMYGGSGSPFRGMAPMQVSGSTPSVQNIPTGQSVSMDTIGENTAVTGIGTTTTTASDGSTVQYKPNPEGTGTIATIVPNGTGSTAGTTGTREKGTRREPYGDGYAMVQRDANGLIIQVYRIEADGTKKILRDIQSDVEGAQAQAGQAAIKPIPYTGDPMEKWTDTDAPSQPPPKVVAEPTKKWEAGAGELSPEYLKWLGGKGGTPTPIQPKEFKEPKIPGQDQILQWNKYLGENIIPYQTQQKIAISAGDDPQMIADKAATLGGVAGFKANVPMSPAMLQKSKFGIGFDPSAGDMTWDINNPNQALLYENQILARIKGQREQADRRANALYMGAGGANVPPIRPPLPMPNTNLPHGYTNYIGFGGANPPIIAGNPAATAAAYAQWVNQGRSNYNINRPSVLDLANAYNYSNIRR